MGNFKDFDLDLRNVASGGKRSQMDYQRLRLRLRSAYPKCH